MIVIGIESSCDDTAVAIISDRKILSHKFSSQIDIHKKYGGVVPELAARKHLAVISQLCEEALKEANLAISDINLIAATGGPGLIGGVITSVSFAKGLSLANNTPFIAVNHLEGHALVARFERKDLEFPFLLFLASGGHCQLLICEDVGKYQLIGQTADDAIGEAFDKTAKLMGLSYPGGPEIEKKALEGDVHKYDFPFAIKMKNKSDFSLSGLKTSVRYKIDDLADNLGEQEIADISASFQYAVSKQITRKLKYAFEEFDKKFPDKNKNLVFAGGVASNKYLRNKIEEATINSGFKLICPEPQLCVDNAVMIAWAGLESYKQGRVSDYNFKPLSKWPLASSS